MPRLRGGRRPTRRPVHPRPARGASAPRRRAGEGPWAWSSARAPLLGRRIHCSTVLYGPAARADHSRGQPSSRAPVTKAPAQTFALLIGWILTIAGIVGFFYCASFEAGRHVPSEDVFGLLSVNGWHDVVHLVTGLIGIRAARTWGGARVYSFALFVLYP